MTEQQIPAARAIAREIETYAHPETTDHFATGQLETWAITNGKHDELEVDARLDSGAGMGHAHLTLTVDVDGERIAVEYIDVGTLMERWVNAVVDDELERRRADKAS